VARADDLDTATAASPEPLGPVESMNRGDLAWRLTVPQDGSVPLGGAGPLLIRWDGPHPAARLSDDGFELVNLEVAHPDPDRVTKLVAAVGFAGPVTVSAGETMKLTAGIRTPAGTRRL
jgi:hypothetical protein